ncbi:hypothetical protein QTH11_02890 [Clostridium perfringens]|nr:hypothetical protein [Clostridium perfringens]MDM0465397.1 hypothetical protein [Clostridium perfringens]HAT4246207.1 hypothetical protein [Clostridium perfringens]
MAKASVPMALQTKHESKEERARREEMEKKLRGKKDKLVPPSNLTEGAKRYFVEIVDNLKESELLGNGDKEMITIVAMTQDKIDFLESKI